MGLKRRRRDFSISQGNVVMAETWWHTFWTTLYIEQKVRSHHYCYHLRQCRDVGSTALRLCRRSTDGNARPKNKRSS